MALECQLVGLTTLAMPRWWPLNRLIFGVILVTVRRRSKEIEPFHQARSLVESP